MYLKEYLKDNLLGEFFFQGQETDGARHFHYD
jgi:hypothetical protein